MSVRKRYESNGFEVSFDGRRCIHAAECVRRLPAVFEVGRRPWIVLEEADENAVAAVVEKCPSGALEYRRLGGAGEAIPAENRARLRPRGPLYVTGDVELVAESGETVRGTRMALCRCGASKNKPFCDNAHRSCGFDDPGKLGESRLAGEEAEPGRLTLRLAPDGPILVNGSLEVLDVAGQEHRGKKGALCRCGASQVKPYCDGSHRDIGFESDSPNVSGKQA